MRYVIQPEHLAAAREKVSPPGQRESLDDLERLVDRLERTFLPRLGEARSQAGVPDPQLSRAEKEEIAFRKKSCSALANQRSLLSR